MNSGKHPIGRAQLWPCRVCGAMSKRALCGQHRPGGRAAHAVRVAKNRAMRIKNAVG
jgi:hypothetical protein